MKLISVIEITGTITVLSGLHIGTGAPDFTIGGVDLPVVRDHLRNPYIPASTIRGRMRALLELRSGLIDSEKPSEVPLIAIATDSSDTIKSAIATKLIKFFGVSSRRSGGTEQRNYFGSSRLMVADGVLIDSSSAKVVTETKYETSLNRITGIATPRQIERIVSGTIFRNSFGIKVFEGDNEDESIGLLIDGLRAIEQDALGGHGSRGYGKVKFSLDGLYEARLRANKEITTLLSQAA
jgi:CRISPR-associated protein Csm3